MLEFQGSYGATKPVHTHTIILLKFRDLVQRSQATDFRVVLGLKEQAGGGAQVGAH